jgi:TonB family protein
MAVKQSGKILRIGVMHGGRIIEDRYIRKWQTITVGESPKATFVLPFGKLPIPKLFPLFVEKKDHYELAFTDSMTGKLSINDDISSLKDLISSGKAHNRGKTFHFPIKDNVKGTVRIGDVTLIFHFVQAPPMPAKAKLPASIRGGWVKSLDWPYMIILMLSFMVHAGVLGYASTVPIPKTTSLEMIPDRFAKMIMTDLPKFKEDQKLPTEGEGDQGAKKEEKKSSQGEKKEDAGEQKPKREMSDEELAEAAARRKAEIAKKVAGAGLVALLTAKGPDDGSMTALSDTLSEGGRFGSIDDTMQGVTGMAIAKEATDRGRRGSPGGDPKSKSLTDVGTSEGGTAQMGKKAEKEISGSAKLGELGDVDGSLDAGSIKRVVKRNLGAIKLCYDQELRRNPKLAGKVTMEVSVTATGTVAAADVVSSSLKNGTVESCIARTIKRWRFPKPKDGDVIFTYPFIFEASR